MQWAEDRSLIARISPCFVFGVFARDCRVVTISGIELREAFISRKKDR